MYCSPRSGIKTLFPELFWMTSNQGSTVVNTRKVGMLDPNILSEEAIVSSIKSGNTDLIGELVRRHSDQLFLIILRMVRSRSVAEDMLQETWIRVVGKFHRFDSSKPLMPWLVRIALNCCHDHFRKERVRRLWPLSAARDKQNELEYLQPEREHESLTHRIDVDRGLQELSPKLREVVVLKFYSGLTHAEISSIMGIPEGTVKSRLNFALTKLRHYFDIAEKKK